MAGVGSSSHERHAKPARPLSNEPESDYAPLSDEEDAAKQTERFIERGEQQPTHARYVDPKSVSESQNKGIRRDPNGSHRPNSKDYEGRDASSNQENSKGSKKKAQ